ncbi:MAG: pilus assembly protein [Planctomycetes bacterium]|nr:pilus assembly protein [Planctomycetota bacterium]
MVWRGEPRRGIAAVEMAIVLPVVLLLLVGIWEVGRLVEVQQLLTNAAREGGRQASTGVKSSSEVTDVVVRYLQQNGIKSVAASDVSVTNITSGSRPEPNAANQLDQFRVSVSIPFDSVRWVLLSQVSSVKTLTASSEWYSMRDIPITVDANIPLQ